MEAVFDALPADVLALVCAQLPLWAWPRLRQVCRAWHRAITDGVVALDFTELRHAPSLAAQLRLALRCRCLQRLVLTHSVFESVCDRTLLQALDALPAPALPFLVELVVHCAKAVGLTDVGLQALAVHIPRVRSVSLVVAQDRVGALRDSALSEAGLCGALALCCDVEQLRVTVGSSAPGADAVPAVLPQRLFLRQLDLRNFRPLSSGTLAQLVQRAAGTLESVSVCANAVDTAALAALREHCAPTLHTLELFSRPRSGLPARTPDDRPRLGAAALAHVCALRALTCLRLDGNVAPDSCSVAGLLHALPALASLTLWALPVPLHDGGNDTDAADAEAMGEALVRRIHALDRFVVVPPGGALRAFDSRLAVRVARRPPRHVLGLCVPLLAPDFVDALLGAAAPRPSVLYLVEAAAQGGPARSSEPLSRLARGVDELHLCLKSHVFSEPSNVYHFVLPN